MEATNVMATNRQLFALWLASGKSHDYRNDNLTKEQASQMLDEFNKNSGYTKESTKNDKKKESKPRPKAEPKPKANKFGVKVGDVFHMSWGYDQTNNDFFQVVELCGEQSVRVREVSLEFTSTAIGFMGEDRVFKIPQDGELAPHAVQSIWIKDQKRGDIKRLQSWSGDGTTNPYIRIENHHATKCEGKTIKCYESWYA